MVEIRRIIENVYSAMHIPIIAFTTKGELLWHSKEVIEILEQNNVNADESQKINIDDIIFNVLNSQSDSGNILMLFGGKFNKTIINKTHCFIVELYQNDKILDFFVNPQISEFVEDSSSSFKKFVVKTSSSFNHLRSIIGSDSPEGQLLNSEIDEILDCCLNMNRKISAPSIMSALAKNTDIPFNSVSLSQFLIHLKDGCKFAFQGKIYVNMSPVENILFTTNTKMLNYFILFYIRKYILSYINSTKFINSSVEQYIPTLDIQCVVKEKSICLTLTLCKGEKPLPTQFHNSELGIYSPMIMKISEKIKASAKVCKNKIVITIDKQNSPAKPMLNAASEQFDNDRFSIYCQFLGYFDDEVY